MTHKRTDRHDRDTRGKQFQFLTLDTLYPQGETFDFFWTMKGFKKMDRINFFLLVLNSPGGSSI